MLNLPPVIAEACKPLFDTLPLDQAMPHLLGSHPCHTALVESITQHPDIAKSSELVAGLWLYVDDLDRSHVVSQGIEDTTGSYWHGIMHRREGDFRNSRYWHIRASGHPLLKSQNGLVTEVEQAQGQDLPELLTKQREEWKALFEWCAKKSK